MIKQNPSSTLQLCSRCLSHEIQGWMNEKWKELHEEARKQILEELRAIRLREGNCIVCNNSIVSADTIERIMIILNQNNVSEKTKKEFQKLFCVF